MCRAWFKYFPHQKYADFDEHNRRTRTYTQVAAILTCYQWIIAKRSINKPLIPISLRLALNSDLFSCVVWTTQAESIHRSYQIHDWHDLHLCQNRQKKNNRKQFSFSRFNESGGFFFFVFLLLLFGYCKQTKSISCDMYRKYSSISWRCSRMEWDIKSRII